MRYDAIPNSSHIVRQVPWAKLRKVVNDDGDEVPVGVLHTAFQPRDVDDYLSATHQEFFPGTGTEQIALAVQAVRRTWTCKPKSGFAIGNVGAIKATCAERGHQVRILEEPVSGNDAHVAVKRYPQDHTELFEALAADSWSTLVLNSSIPHEGA